VRDVALQPGHRRTYAALNAVVAPIWLAMILLPRSAATRWLVERTTAVCIALGIGYDALLAAGMIRNGKPVDFSNPEEVRQALSQPELFLAGWSHYIAFDLFAGRWIWQDALEAGRSARLALLLTFLAGPAGLSLYLVQRSR
jgi:hypothetical protein